MIELDLCKGLRVYGVYKLEKYPEFVYLCTDIDTNYDGSHSIEGLEFTNDGRFTTMVNLRLPLRGEEVGYIYIPNVGYSLELKFHNRGNSK